MAVTFCLSRSVMPFSAYQLCGRSGIQSSGALPAR
jgi:hypothetical protein